ncbi:hypothetical protein RFI_13415 [Reticulomyxa filosa]|uniref:Uncharacterized protein n=1 Tax=Reticulomyxa filosa TaxID=46433 RepID=X6NDB5_RETFI|nr:hypothetical protein RFI_13415 [Reticulomyxa filosa]|eukprot:ETO23764.1 hypothetical protein RFI_13415 [Reticulomyxa filosa]
MLEYTASKNEHAKNEKEYENILNPISTKICKAINDSLTKSMEEKYPGKLLSFEALYMVNESNSLRAFYNEAISKFVNAEKTLMITLVTLDVDGVSQETLNGIVDNINSIANNMTHYYSSYGYDVVTTGGLTIFKESMETIKADITSRDLYVLPFIFAFMIFMVFS